MPTAKARLRQDIVCVLAGITTSYSALQMTMGEPLPDTARDKVAAAIMRIESAIIRLEKISDHVRDCEHGCMGVAS